MHPVAQSSAPSRDPHDNDVPTDHLVEEQFVGWRYQGHSGNSRAAARAEPSQSGGNSSESSVSTSRRTGSSSSFCDDCVIL